MNIAMYTPEVFVFGGTYIDKQNIRVSHKLLKRLASAKVSIENRRKWRMCQGHRYVCCASLSEDSRFAQRLVIISEPPRFGGEVKRHDIDMATSSPRSICWLLGWTVHT